MVFLATLVAASVPYSPFGGTVFVLGIPAINMAFIGLMFSALLRTRAARLGPVCWSWMAAILWMAVTGFVRSDHANFDWRTFVQDAVVCSGLVAGFLWARSLPRSETARLLWIGYALCTIVLLASVLMFRLGVFVAPTVREVDPANYFSSFYLAVTLPVLRALYGSERSRSVVLW